MLGPSGPRKLRARAKGSAGQAGSGGSHPLFPALAPSLETTIFQQIWKIKIFWIYHLFGDFSFSSKAFSVNLMHFRLWRPAIGAWKWVFERMLLFFFLGGSRGRAGEDLGRSS